MDVFLQHWYIYMTNWRVYLTSCINIFGILHTPKMYNTRTKVYQRLGDTSFFFLYVFTFGPTKRTIAPPFAYLSMYAQGKSSHKKGKSPGTDANRLLLIFLFLHCNVLLRIVSISCMHEWRFCKWCKYNINGTVQDSLLLLQQGIKYQARFSKEETLVYLR